MGLTSLPAPLPESLRTRHPLSWDHRSCIPAPAPSQSEVHPSGWVCRSNYKNSNFIKIPISLSPFNRSSYKWCCAGWSFIIVWHMVYESYHCQYVPLAPCMCSGIERSLISFYRSTSWLNILTQWDSVYIPPVYPEPVVFRVYWGGLMSQWLDVVSQASGIWLDLYLYPTKTYCILMMHLYN